MSEHHIGITEVGRHESIWGKPHTLWADLLDFIDDNDIDAPFDLLVLGKLYLYSDEITGDTVHVRDMIELVRAIEPGENDKSAKDTRAIVERFFDMKSLPDHILGFVIRTPD